MWHEQKSLWDSSRQEFSVVSNTDITLLWETKRERARWLLVSSLEFGLGHLVIMLYFWAKHSTVRHLSLPKSINGYWGIAREAWWNAEGNLAMDWHLIMREVETLIIASCFKDRDKLYGPLCLSTDLIKYLRVLESCFQEKLWAKNSLNLTDLPLN